MYVKIIIYIYINYNHIYMYYQATTYQKQKQDVCVLPLNVQVNSGQLQGAAAMCTGISPMLPRKLLLLMSIPGTKTG